MSLAAARLKRANPNTFGELCTALESMSAETSTRCVQAAPDQVLLWQGRARQLVDLVALFKDCIQTAEKLEAKMKERQNGR